MSNYKNERQLRELFKPFYNSMNGGKKNSAKKSIIKTTVSPEETYIKHKNDGTLYTEIEQLSEKYQEEFDIVIPYVVENIENVLSIHSNLKDVSNNKYSYYNVDNEAGITLKEYIYRICNHSHISPSSLVCSLIILDRLSGRNRDLLFTYKNIHKLLCIAIRLSSKILEFKVINCNYYANIAGISENELNIIEKETLINLRFDLYISPNEFIKYADNLSNGMYKKIAVLPEQTNKQ